MNQYPVFDIDGDRYSHLPDWQGTYDSACGIDADDPNLGHSSTAEYRRYVDCPDCCRLWREMRKHAPRVIKDSMS